MTMDPRGVEWLAGLLEGEAHFQHSENVRGAAVDLAMTDQDVIERAAFLMDGKVVRRDRDGYLPVFRVTVSGRRARKIMEDVLPFMGKRRAERIIACLSDGGWGFSESQAQGAHQAAIRRRGPKSSEACRKGWETRRVQGTGLACSPETRAAVSAAHKGIAHSSETRAKVSASLKRYHALRRA